MKLKSTFLIIFCLLSISFQAFSETIADTTKPKGIGVQASIGSTTALGFPFIPTLTYTLPKHRFFLGPELLLVGGFYPNNYKERYAFSAGYIYYPFGQYYTWSIYLSTEVQGFSYYNFPGVGNPDSSNGKARQFSVSVSPGIQLKIYRSFYFFMQVGYGFYSSRFDYSYENIVNRNNFSVALKTGLGYDL